MFNHHFTEYNEIIWNVNRCFIQFLRKMQTRRKCWENFGLFTTDCMLETLYKTKTDNYFGESNKIPIKSLGPLDPKRFSLWARVLESEVETLFIYRVKSNDIENLLGISSVYLYAFRREA